MKIKQDLMGFLFIIGIICIIITLPFAIKGGKNNINIRYKKAFELGRSAYLSNITSESNPYIHSNYTFLAPIWQQGWIEAEQNAKEGILGGLN